MVERNVLATADGVKAFDWWAATWVNYAGHDAVSFHYADRRASAPTADLVRELVRRLADDEPEPLLERTLVTVRADIDWRAATLTYLLTVLAAGLRSEAGAGGPGEWTNTVVTPALDALESTTIVRELTARGRVDPKGRTRASGA